MVEKVKWEHCPRCGSNKVKKTNKKHEIHLIFIIVAGIIIPSSIIKIILALAMIIKGIEYIVSSFKNTLTCNDCDFEWNPPYEKQENSIKTEYQTVDENELND